MKAVGRLSKWSYYLLILPVTLGFCLWQGWAWWSWAQSPPTPDKSTDSALDKAVQIQIPSGTAAQQIGKDLEAAGLIRSSHAWKLWTHWKQLFDRDGEYKAGTYQLSSTQPLPEIASKIWNGEVVQLSFTIPEGWSIEQMANHFEKLGYFPAQDFIAATRQIPKDKYPWLPSDLPHLEGFLYPNTYQLSNDRVSPQIIIEQMLKEFEQKALPLYQKGQQSMQLSLVEWVTFASIVEKEAVVSKERPLIAGVFAERLRRGMRLESDPTVEYGLGIRQTADQPLTYAQVGIESPYNTYLNPGLPPTAIASPGLASLRASLDPEKTDFLFFVARYDGTHKFSKTLKEHEAARDSIRRERKSQQ
ncbi:MAG: endolytic transglycosylase MltG [Symploca sp. SIO3C6]|nr:endolytic transglycosylase MltG [Symploca sp. SIO3C6]